MQNIPACAFLLFLMKEKKMETPTDLIFSENDEWIRVEGDKGTVGITDFAQDQLSDIVFVEFLVDEGETVDLGDTIATVESVKAAADIYTPVGGMIIAINEDLADSPELINADPFGEAWLVKIELSDPTDLDDLMDSISYANFREIN
jgi:glycine cleavage system H protein